ncbi:MAG: winged helix-turn-helix domain-containing protein [Candidatus Jordarchaeales archaeon]
MESLLNGLNIKLDELLRNVRSIHDLLLQLTAMLEVVGARAAERELLSQISLEVNEGLSAFKAGVSTCSLRDFCVRRVEKAAFKVLQVVADRGVEDALVEVKRHLEALEKHVKDCPDEKCLKNAARVFKAVEELIKRSRRPVSNVKFLFGEPGGFDEVEEDKIAELLPPLSSPMRIRILKVLSRGGRSFADLERATSMRGGHLQFHLSKLVEAGFVVQEKPRGRYVLTRSGLAVLRLLRELAGQRQPVLSST